MENIADSPVCNTKGKTVGQENKTKHAIESKDYINCLPNAVLFHIFSLLPLEVLVLASLVSKQWESLVKTYLSTIPLSLNFDELEMAVGIICTHNNILPSQLNNLHSIHRISLRNAVIDGTENFNQFVNRTLHLLTGCITKKLCFKLCYDGLQDSRQKVDQWFHFAITNEVKELELNFAEGILIGWSDPSIAYELPHVQCASKSLERVALNFCNLIISNLEAFGYIQSLFLKYVKVLGFSIEDLVTKCPMLKDLTVECCSIPWDFMICRRDIMIKSLTMIRCSTQNWSMCPIDISAPELLIFTLEKCHLTAETNIKAQNLTDVSIVINQLHACSTQRRALVKLLGQSSHCQLLSLNTWCIQVLSYGAHLLQQSPIPFNNLKHLKLGVGLEKGELPGIAYIMRNCPYMESLTLYIYEIATIHWGDLAEQVVFEFDENIYWQAQVSTFRCLQCCLKEVTVHGISGRTSETQMLRFLLENAKVLEEMSVYTPGENLGLQIYQQLTSYQKASPDARICMFGYIH